MEGLSSRALILNQGMDVVILLYLFEEEASWLVKVTSVFTLVLGVFKIVKSLRVKARDLQKAAGGIIRSVLQQLEDIFAQNAENVKAYAEARHAGTAYNRPHEYKANGYLCE